MKASASNPGDTTLQEPYDFSLVLGGPLFQLLRRARLTGDALELLRRRLLIIPLLAWLPLLVLSVMEGHAWGGGIKMPFLRDIEVHVRFLLVVPLLVAAELMVHQRMRPVVRQFVDRGLIPDTARAQFGGAIASALRLRNSVLAEGLLLAFVYLVGVMLIWRTWVAMDLTSWFGTPAAGKLQPSLAGWWYGCVSLPLFQFLLFRWYFRLFIWGRFLWQVSRIELNLLPTHPDRCAGLGFLALVSYAFSPLLLAQGFLLAGQMANRIFFAGSKLTDFKVEFLGIVAVMVFVVLGPLLVFSPRLERVKRAGLREYGTLAQRHAREFDQKWLRGGAPAGEPLVGSPDISSLADIGTGFDTVKGMRWLPFTPQTVVQLAVTTLVPVLPLMLTMIPLEQLVDRLLKVVF